MAISVSTDISPLMISGAVMSFVDHTEPDGRQRKRFPFSFSFSFSFSFVGGWSRIPQAIDVAAVSQHDDCDRHDGIVSEAYPKYL